MYIEMVYEFHIIVWTKLLLIKKQCPFMNDGHIFYKDNR